MPLRYSSRIPLRAPGRVLLLLLLLSILLVPVFPAEAAKQRLQDRLQRGEALLREGRFAEALEVSGPLLHDAGPQIVAPTVRGQEALGTVMGLHALALAGVAVGDGRPEDAGFDPVSDTEREALFYWGLAQSLQPALRRSTLEVYGEAGRWLAEYRYDGECRLLKPDATPDSTPDSAPDATPDSTLGSAPDSMQDATVGEAGSPEQEPADPGEGESWLAELTDEGPEAVGEEDEMEPPVKVHAPPPVYNREALQAGIVGEVVINSVVAPDGRIHHPCVIETASPAFVYHLGEAVKEWRFEPARKHGEPVASYYQLTTNFQWAK